MICILEGPDGAGKTTLARQLQERYKLTYHHEGPPPKGVSTLEHYGAVLDGFRGKDVVIDRFALGERVYGPILRGHDSLGNWGWRCFHRLVNATAAFQVLCLPPYEICRKNWASGRPELFKDEAKFEATYTLFAGLNVGQFHYDYTKPTAFEELVFCLDMVHGLVRGRDIELPPGYVGQPGAKYLFVGDRGSNPHAKHDLPFFATVGSSQFLNECIAEAGFIEQEIAFVNARERILIDASSLRGPQLLVSFRPRKLQAFPKMIALGALAADILDDQGFRNYSVVPHPQYWKRFHHDQKFAYVEKLASCVIS